MAAADGRKVGTIYYVPCDADADGKCDSYVASDAGKPGDTIIFPENTKGKQNIKIQLKNTNFTEKTFVWNTKYLFNFTLNFEVDDEFSRAIVLDELILDYFIEAVKNGKKAYGDNLLFENLFSTTKLDKEIRIKKCYRYTWR